MFRFEPQVAIHSESVQTTIKGEHDELFPAYYDDESR